MKPKSPPAKAHSEIEIVRLLWLAIFISVFSFLFYYRNGDLLLYGDAVAHINIARRVFDSRTPGLLQLGTVWLPLPHLLILPFIVSNQMWQSGAGGSMPSMAAFALSVIGIFRLVRTILGPDPEGQYAAKLGAWAAAILYVANPNLIFMQATAMGEALYLAFFIWAVAFFAEFVRGNPKALTRCGQCLTAACLTRYDGWFLAGVLVLAAIAFHLFKEFTDDPAAEAASSSSRAAILKFILIAAAAPALWLAYNAAVYRNPFEFANGPYSAKAIEQKTATVNPAKGDLVAAGSYFLKAAELNVGESSWMGRVWLALALLGSLSTWLSRRRRTALLLWIPLPFYALSLAYGSVPIFVPPWWPFSIYNIRYGLQLLPAFAVFVPMGISFLVQSAMKLPRFKNSRLRWPIAATALGILLLAVSSYAAIWSGDPICYREAEVNMKTRFALDRQLGDWIKNFPPNSTLLMYLGEHVGALEQAGIPLRRTINEGNHRVWKRPSDPEGLWEHALADPAAYADYVIGFQGDPVWIATRDQHLTALVEIHTTGQPPAVIFQGRNQGRTPAETPPSPESTR
jgi:hypothetical protein